jgi:hypothetical protein
MAVKYRIVLQENGVDEPRIDEPVYSDPVEADRECRFKNTDLHAARDQGYEYIVRPEKKIIHLGMKRKHLGRH